MAALDNKLYRIRDKKSGIYLTNNSQFGIYSSQGTAKGALKTHLGYEKRRQDLFNYEIVEYDLKEVKTYDPA